MDMKALSQVLFAGLIFLSSGTAKAADHYPAQALAQHLARMKEDTQSLKKLLTTGAMLGRLHALKNGELVKEKIRDLDNATRSLQKKLQFNFRLERTGEYRGTDEKAQRAVVLEFNAFIRASHDLSIVFDEDNTFGAFGGSEEPLAKGISELTLTPFDYSRGFLFECKSEWKSGLVAHRNRITGEITWHSSWKSGVAVLGENADGSPIIGEEWRTGISSAFDPIAESWLVSDGGWKTPSASVYNPDLRQVERRNSDWREGLAGVYNPRTRKVEWNSEWSSGVAGYFDSNQGKVVWIKKWKEGVACIWRDPSGEFHTSAGVGFDSDD